jgi:hypothetical protein
VSGVLTGWEFQQAEHAVGLKAHRGRVCCCSAAAP